MVFFKIVNFYISLKSVAIGAVFGDRAMMRRNKKNMPRREFF
jgi:hypothetical protein